MIFGASMPLKVQRRGEAAALIPIVVRKPYD